MNNDLTLSVAIDGYKSEAVSVRSVSELAYVFDKNRDIIENIDKNDDSQKCRIPIVYTFLCQGKRTYDNFTNSNVVIIDLDDKPECGCNYEYTSMLFENPEYFGRFVMDSVLFIQKSFNGASHIAVKIPTAETIDQYRKYAEGAVKLFRRKFREEFGVWIPEDKKVLDAHSNKCTQGCFLSPYPIINCDDANTKPISYGDMVDMDSIFGYNKKEQQSLTEDNVILNKEEVGDDSDKTIQDSSLKSCGFLGNVTDCESDNNLLNKTQEPSKVAVSYSILPSTYTETATFEGWSFENNVTVPYCDNQIVLDFTCKKNMLNKILDEVIDHYKEDTAYRITLYRPAIYDESVYSVKLKLYRPYNKDGALKIKQGGKRRLNIKKAAKVAVLNYIASVNYGNKFIHTSNIIATIKHYILNHIELNGSTRKIDDDMVVGLIKELKNGWNDIKIEYSVNSFWYKRDKDEDNIAYMTSLRRRKNSTIDSTAKSFIDANCLGGLGYGKIAEILNTYSIAAKTKKGWSEFSVGNIFRKDSTQPEIAYGTRIEELLGEGLMYKDIAETLNKENYTTKQGKAFNAKSIENYVKRKLKK